MSEEDFSKVERLLVEANPNEAHQRLQAMVRRNPEKYAADAVSMYLVASMYEEAKSIFRLYKNLTGKDLTDADFTLDDIEKEIKARDEIVNGSVLKIKRHFFQFSKKGTRAYKSITIDKNKIEIVEYGKARSYAWDDILKRQLRINYQGINRYGSAFEYVLELVTNDGLTLCYDLSAAERVHPEQVNIFISALLKHCGFTQVPGDHSDEYSNTPKDHPVVIGIAIVLCLILFAVKTYEGWLRNNNTSHLTKNAAGYYNQGYHLAQAGNLKEAKGYFIKARDMEPSVPDYHYAVCKTQSELGEMTPEVKSECDKTIQNIVDTNPNVTASFKELWKKVQSSPQ
jgi:tetratricopeptide (TPR) repeat protein